MMTPSVRPLQASSSIHTTFDILGVTSACPSNYSRYCKNLSYLKEVNLIKFSIIVHTVVRIPKVAVVMGSKSDWDVMKEAVDILKQFGVDVDVRVVSAHRTPEVMFEYVKKAVEGGVEVIVAGAGGAAALPGMIAALARIPVVGVPIPSKYLNGIDSLLSIVQMPYGVPVATVGVGNSKNAALLALRILAIKYPQIAEKLEEFMKAMRGEVLSAKLE